MLIMNQILKQANAIFALKQKETSLLAFFIYYIYSLYMLIMN